MSETVPAVPAAEPVVATEATTPATTPNATNKKHDQVGKAVATKFKSLFSFLHNAGEEIRGNINAALDGAGDAIAGRKSGEVKTKSSKFKSTPTTTPAADASTEPVAAATTTHNIAAPAPEAVVAPAEASTTDTPNAASPSEEKKYPVGQTINNSFKRTATLVHRVTDKFLSGATQKADALGTTISQGKQRASKRFSRTPRVPATETVAEESAVPQTNTNAESVPVQSALAETAAAPAAAPAA